MAQAAEGGPRRACCLAAEEAAWARNRPGGLVSSAFQASRGASPGAGARSVEGRCGRLSAAPAHGGLGPTEQAAGFNPLGLLFPSPKGHYWRSSNFDRRVLAPAYRAADWRDVDGSGKWTWHSLRHVFCTAALFTLKLEPTDASRTAGHANYRITLHM